jgi:hypothetical protein
LNAPEYAFELSDIAETAAPAGICTKVHINFHGVRQQNLMAPQEAVLGLQRHPLGNEIGRFKSPFA